MILKRWIKKIRLGKILDHSVFENYELILWPTLCAEQITTFADPGTLRRNCCEENFLDFFNANLLDLVLNVELKNCELKNCILPQRVINFSPTNSTEYGQSFGTVNFVLFIQIRCCWREAVHFERFQNV